MTDEAYTFRQTEVERKRLGRGALAKKNGCRSKKCSLPSDKLTEKQKKELNSEVKTYNTGKPMDWTTFKTMPKDVQGLYLERLCKVYKGRKKDAAEMFGITPGGLSNYIRANFGNYHPFKDLDGKKGVSLTWLKFAKPEEFEEPEVKEPEPEVKDPEETTSCVKQPELFSLDSGELRFTGNLRSTLSKILYILEPEARYSLTLSFTRIQDTAEL